MRRLVNGNGGGDGDDAVLQGGPPRERSDVTGNYCDVTRAGEGERGEDEGVRADSGVDIPLVL